jgi:glycosyltransferase involved in cell wall biosynthesis
LDGDELEAGIEATIRAVGMLDHDVHLVLGGDGSARTRLEAVAAAHCAGRAHFLGVLADPRPLYAAVDVLVGRGTTVARAMAHAKPAVAQDEHGSPCLVDEASLPFFREHAFVDVPPERRGVDAVLELAAILERLLREPTERDRLGSLGREVICSDFALDRVAPQIEAIYREAVTDPVPRLRVVHDDVRHRVRQARRHRARRRR